MGIFDLPHRNACAGRCRAHSSRRPPRYPKAWQGKKDSGTALAHQVFAKHFNAMFGNMTNTATVHGKAGHLRLVSDKPQIVTNDPMLDHLFVGLSEALAALDQPHKRVLAVRKVLKETGRVP